MKRYLWLVAFCFLVMGSYPMNVKVNLWSGHEINSFTFSHLSGKYIIHHGNIEITSVSNGEQISFRFVDDHILLIENDRVIYAASNYHITGAGMNNSFALTIAGFSIRNYDDDLNVYHELDQMKLVNVVDLEKYVGGVIQAEAGGSTKLVEYFKVQALISRTYAVRLISLHGHDFCLKDDVSHQVYKGKPVRNEILAAVQATVGQVIVYNDTELINAVFHSNSGGATLSSDHVWMSSLPYLKPVLDTFAVNMRNAVWTYSMPTVEWLDYLNKRFGYSVQVDSLKRYALNFQQPVRMKYFFNSIPLTTIRADLNLKSTFFEISTEKDQVVFKGRGFGHGVGLSQEGAIRMAELGYPANDIVCHYYSGVSIRNLSDLLLVALSN